MWCKLRISWCRETAKTDNTTEEIRWKLIFKTQEKKKESPWPRREDSFSLKLHWTFINTLGHGLKIRLNIWDIYIHILHTVYKYIYTSIQPNYQFYVTLLTCINSCLGKDYVSPTMLSSVNTNTPENVPISQYKHLVVSRHLIKKMLYCCHKHTRKYPKVFIKNVRCRHCKHTRKCPDIL